MGDEEQLFVQSREIKRLCSEINAREESNSLSEHSRPEDNFES